MTFDVHQLDTFLLVGAGVTLLAILAVRVSSRAGLPSLLLYLLMGVALGDNGIGIHFENAELAHALGFAALAADPGRRRSVDQLARGAAVDAARPLPGHPRGRRVGDDRRARCALPAGAVVGAVRAARRGDLADRRRRGLLGAARPSAVAAAGRVRSRPSRGSTTRRRSCWSRSISTGAVADHGMPSRWASSPSSSLAGLLIGLAIGFGGAWLMRRAALPSSGLYPLAVLCLALLAYGASAGLHASGFAAIYVAALVLGNSDLPHRHRDPLVRGGRGLAGPDRAVRDARAAAHAQPDHAERDRDRRGGKSAADLRRPSDHACGSARSSHRCPGARPRSCRGPGCAGRCRSCSPRSRSPRRSPTRSGSSTSCS